MTNVGDSRKSSGCKSDNLEKCCLECSNNISCSSKCNISLSKKTPVFPSIPANRNLPTIGIHNLLAGIVVGIIAALVAGYLLSLIMQLTGFFYYIFLVICGGIGGLGFGLPTRGNKTARGLIGCMFAVLAMAVGFYFIYTAPIAIDSTMTVTASSIMSFQEFLSSFLEPIDYVFMLAGIALGYFAGSREH